MGRIEDALRKLEEARRQPSAPRTSSSAAPVAPKPLAQLPPLTLNTNRSLVLDEVALRRWGPILLGAADRIRREYGQIKRPVLAHALNRSAAPTVGGNVVLVTSAISGEGKSLTAFNLALSLGLEKDLSVVLVDADTIKPDLSRTLGLDQTLGLTDLLVDESLQFSDVLTRTSAPGLYFIGAGQQRAGATELLGSPRMLQLVEGMARDLPRTVIVIDSSPLLLTTEAPVLVSLAGQVVLVVRANHTSRSLLTDALERLDRAKPVGLVLNAVNASEVGHYGAYDSYAGRADGDAEALAKSA